LIDDAAPQPPTPTRFPRRTRLDHLTHIRIPHDVPESEKTCSCFGGPQTLIGEDEPRELDYVPARLEVRVHVVPKCACSKCRDGVVSTSVPPKPTGGTAVIDDTTITGNTASTSDPDVFGTFSA
jgi:transposase